MANAAHAAVVFLIPCAFLGGCSGGGTGSNPAPMLVSVGPAQGPAAGATALALQGTGFLGSVSVTVGGNAASAVEVLDDRNISCSAPAGVPGLAARVTVSAAGGTATLPAAFRYNPLPTLTSASPETGFAPGGFELSLEGTGFAANSAGPCTVTVGGFLGTTVAVQDTRLSCTAPAGVVGPADVSVSNANGTAILTGGLTYFEYPSNFPAFDARLDTDGAGASVSRWPRVSCDGPNVRVAWSDQRDGLGDIYFNRSIDGGVTWLANDVRLDTDVAGTGESRNLHAICDGPNVYVVWQDERNGAADVYFNRSADGGATWLADDVRLETDFPGDAASVYPRLACVGTTVYAVWRDDRDGAWDVYFNRSTDGGVTWLANDVRLDSGLPGAASSVFHRVCAAGSNVYVTWYDYRNGANGDIYFQRSTNGGTNWLVNDVRLDTDLPGAGHSYRSEMCADGTSVYVVWLDQRNGATDVYFNRSIDAGNMWLASDVRLDTDTPGAAECGWPLLACERSSVYVVWGDARNGATDVYMNRSTDGGATWLGSDVRLDRSPIGTSDSDNPMVCVDGPNVYVAWQDARNGELDVYLNVSRNGGANWLNDDRRLDTDAAGAAASTAPQVRCAGARVYAAWTDARNGETDIYAKSSRP